MSFKRRMLERLAAKIGYQVVPNWEALEWPELEFQRKLFRYFKPDCIFDVGGNVGQYGLGLRALGYTGKILSFEPVPSAYAQLAPRAAADPNWHAYPFALGAAPGTASINVMAGTDFSSFHKPKEDAGFDGSNVVQETVEVEIKTIAAIYEQLRAEHGFSRPFLKLDTQGFDLQVFDGAGEKAREFVGLVSEVAAKTIYHDAPAMQQSIDRYRSGGFDLLALYAVNPGRFGQLVEFNCYMGRTDLLPKTVKDALAVR